MAFQASEALIFSGTSHQEFAKKISKATGIKLGNVQIQRFPDHEIALQILDDVSDKEIFVVQSIAFEPNEFLMELLILVDTLKRSLARRVTAIIPYYGYCRQDRQDKPNVPITARLVADLLERAGVDKIITADLHAEQIQGFFDIPVRNLHCMTMLVDQVRKMNLDDLIVVTPDVGSIKLGRDMANQLQVDLAIINKQRLNANKVKTFQVIGDVKGKNVLLADDMCSTGATIASAAKACQEKGAKRILACVTHGLFVGEALNLIQQSPIEALITTDTVPSKGFTEKTTDFFQVVSVVPLFAKAIQEVI